MTKKILIVDDEANIVISLEFLMQQAGYIVDVAHTGYAALAKIATFVPDLIILDVMLPGISGFAICEQVRQNVTWQQMKIVMLSAKGRAVEIQKGLALGANAYITKPFSTKELLAEVRRQLEEQPVATGSFSSEK